MQLVEFVARHAQFHSSQDRTNQSTATNVFQTINQNLEEAQVVEDLETVVDLAEDEDLAQEEDLAVEEALTEDHEKCTKRLVETVVKIVKFQSSQDRTNQSTAANAFKVMKEIKNNYHFMFY